ncbi:hypothetical protein KDJ21_026070 [Metabacillus litoralis]|uniref:hypothetical protein n=1 Tax=Metabacillus TaxID=2675233 RepID=UPI001B9297F6|nr:hypothetical protein [Metabacillus litoralis]UHA60134.1 hypothetical protein KDJ21_026070 [Metabacillus litoralis]
MFKLPIIFDKNEWFVMISMVVLLICFIAIPKIIPKSLTITIMLFYAVFGLTADVLIGVDYPFNFYRIMDSPKLELFDVLVYVVNYSLYGYFFSYILYKWKIEIKYLLLFILLWIALTVCLEWMSVKFNVFTYKNGWNTWFSALSYLLIFPASAIINKVFIHFWSIKTMK